MRRKQLTCGSNFCPHDREHAGFSRTVYMNVGVTSGAGVSSADGRKKQREGTHGITEFLLSGSQAHQETPELRKKVGEIPESTTVEDETYQFKVRAAIPLVQQTTSSFINNFDPFLTANQTPVHFI